MSEDIRFETVKIRDKTRAQDRDGVAVIRDGRQVAVLPEVARLNRALSLPLEKVEYIANNLHAVMKSGAVGREPTSDEEEFWRAVLDFRYGQEQNG